MDIKLEPGRYVVAVSGGVDSVVLLDLMARIDGLELIVAHFDHGIRADSAADRRFVQALAGNYGLAFVYDRAELGSTASEDTARRARYDFLHKVRTGSGAMAIVTAHHKDDVLETALLNLLRGTHRKGLSSLRSTQKIVRPLLEYSKRQILDYAKTRDLRWREDSTNQNLQYRRNYLRHKIIPVLSDEISANLTQELKQSGRLNAVIDREITRLLRSLEAADGLNRHRFIMLPHIVAKEIMAAWLRAWGIRQFDKKLIEKLVIAAKTLAKGKSVDIDREHQLAVLNSGTLAIRALEKS